MALAAAAPLACGGERAGTDTAADRTAPDAPPGGARDGQASGARLRVGAAVQLASFADSSSAVAERDSLARRGWHALVRPARVEGRRVWRVLVAPTTAGDRLPKLVAHALRRRGVAALVVRDSLPGSIPESDVTLVNTGSPGMAAQPRWLLAPRGDALLAMEDAVSVEAEPVPNGFVYAREDDGCLFQADSAWSVAPSPDWRRVAFGRAFVLRDGEAETIPERQWRAVAARMGLDVDSVRQAAFDASGMALMRAVSQPVVVEARAGALTARVLRMAGGWRVRWSADGGDLLVGLNPRRAQDDEESTGWLRVDPRGAGAPARAATSSEGAAPAWVTGPLIDVAMDTLMTGRTVAGGLASTSDGFVTVRTEDGARRILGPGVALAATARGRYVVALVPRASARQYDAPLQLAVYSTGIGDVSPDAPTDRARCRTAGWQP